MWWLNTHISIQHAFSNQTYFIILLILKLWCSNTNAGPKFHSTGLKMLFYVFSASYFAGKEHEHFLHPRDWAVLSSAPVLLNDVKVRCPLGHTILTIITNHRVLARTLVADPSPIIAATMWITPAFTNADTFRENEKGINGKIRLNVNRT